MSIILCIFNQRHTKSFKFGLEKKKTWYKLQTTNQKLICLTLIASRRGSEIVIREGEKIGEKKYYIVLLKI